MPRLRILIINILSVFHFLPFLLPNILASPINFCKEADSTRISFCVAASSYHNATSGLEDLYITITSKRPTTSSKGWLGVGLGSSMEGALMILSYGDPSRPNNEATTIVRTAPGHQAPVSLEKMSLPGHKIPVIRVLRSDFSPSDTVEAKMLTAQVVCYDCSSWSATVIDIGSTNQPWIWASNPEQDFDGNFSSDASIWKHDDTSGFGKFNANLASAFEGVWAENSALPPLPTIAKDYHEPIGATDGGTQAADGHGQTHKHSSWRNFFWHVHGLSLIFAFVLLYPLGIYIFSFAPRSLNFPFHLHWIVQTIASGFVALGVLVGFVLSRRIGYFHQYLGLTIPVLILIQAVLGWRAHVIFIHTQRKNTFGWTHGWLGAAIVLAGAGDAIIGLRWRHYSNGLISVVVGVIGLELFALIWFWHRRWKNRKGSTADTASGNRAEGEEYALVGESDSESDIEEGEDDTEANKVTANDGKDRIDS